MCALCVCCSDCCASSAFVSFLRLVAFFLPMAAEQKRGEEEGRERGCGEGECAERGCEAVESRECNECCE